LINNGYILKRGSKRGTTWEWNSQQPDYLMETAVLSGIQSGINNNYESEQSEEQLPNNATIMDVFKYHKIKFSIGNGMSVRFINNSEIELRKNDGRSIRIDNAIKLNELLCFLS